MIPRYELDTLPDPAWPRLYTVSQFGRSELSRSIWGCTILEARNYIKASGYTVETQQGDGLWAFTRPIVNPNSSVSVRLNAAVAASLQERD